MPSSSTSAESGTGAGAAGWVRRALGLARRVPVTVSLTVLVLAMGVATGALWDPLASRPADRGLRLWPSLLRAGPAVDRPDRVPGRFGAGPVRADRAGSGGSGRFRGVALGLATHRGRPAGMPPDGGVADGRHAGPGQRPRLPVRRRPGNAGRCRTVGGVPRSGRRGHGDPPPADAGASAGRPRRVRPVELRPHRGAGRPGARLRHRWRSAAGPAAAGPATPTDRACR